MTLAQRLELLELVAPITVDDCAAIRSLIVEQRPRASVEVTIREGGAKVEVDVREEGAPPLWRRLTVRPG